MATGRLAWSFLGRQDARRPHSQVAVCFICPAGLILRVTLHELMKLLLIFALLFGAIDSANAAENSLGAKIKKIFEPTPTPAPRKHRKRSTKKATPSPSPTASPRHKKTSPTPTATPKTKSKRKNEVSHANSDSRRKPGPKSNRNTKPFTLAASRRKKRRAERYSFAR